MISNVFAPYFQVWPTRAHATLYICNLVPSVSCPLIVPITMVQRHFSRHYWCRSAGPAASLRCHFIILTIIPFSRVFSIYYCSLISDLRDIGLGKHIRYWGIKLIGFESLSWLKGNYVIHELRAGISRSKPGLVYLNIMHRNMPWITSKCFLSWNTTNKIVFVHDIG